MFGKLIWVLILGFVHSFNLPAPRSWKLRQPATKLQTFKTSSNCYARRRNQGLYLSLVASYETSSAYCGPRNMSVQMTPRKGTRGHSVESVALINHQRPRKHRLRETSSRRREEDEIAYLTLETIGTKKLLSHSQEMELGKHIQALIAVESIREELAKALMRPPSDAEWAEACGYGIGERSFFLDVYKNGIKAKHLMVSCNMRLVVAIAKKYVRLGIPLTDLVQDGCLGLIRAAEKYDPSRGFKFSTYAAWWIQQAIFKAIAYNSRTIRLPVHVHNLLYNVRRIRKTFVKEHGRAPTDCEVADKVGIPVERLRRYLLASRTTISTETPSGKSSSKSSSVSSNVLGDTFESFENVAPEDLAEIDLCRSKLCEMMDDLPDEERRIVTLRYGLGSGRIMSLQEIAETSRCSKELIRRTEMKALRMLRAPEHHSRLLEFAQAIPKQRQSTGKQAAQIVRMHK